jgi:GTP-binding protein YchF
MKLGIIGLPGAGKTTIFNALTGGDAPTGQSIGGRFEVLSAIVDVPDDRVDTLCDLYQPKKTTYARITFADIAGLQTGVGKSGGLSGPLLNQLAQMDGFVHVVRAFTSDLFPHPRGAVDPRRDLADIDAELLLNDQVQVESKLERLEDGLRKGAFRNKAKALAEQVLFQRLVEMLNAEQPLRAGEFSAEEAKIMRDYGFLTLKPVLVIINIGDDQPEVSFTYEAPASRLVNLRGTLEAELAQLSGDDLDLFMAEYNVRELGLARIIRHSYELLGLQSFFTVSEDEVHAWTVPQGATALDAAATIHTDLAKGFIRAETIAFSDLAELGSLPAARAAGKLRLEGKTYLVQDGDVVHIKFNL